MACLAAANGLLLLFLFATAVDLSRGNTSLAAAIDHYSLSRPVTMSRKLASLAAAISLSRGWMPSISKRPVNRMVSAAAAIGLSMGWLAL
jgi:hypothetical protein